MSQRDLDFELSPWMDANCRCATNFGWFQRWFRFYFIIGITVSRIDPSLITAVHINHDLSANADSWQASAEDTCKQLGVNFIAKSSS